MALRNHRHVLDELVGDPRAAGQQYLGFEYYRDADGKRVYYDTNGCLNYQQAQERAGRRRSQGRRQVTASVGFEGGNRAPIAGIGVPAASGIRNGFRSAANASQPGDARRRAREVTQPKRNRAVGVGLSTETGRTHSFRISVRPIHVERYKFGLLR